MAFKYTDLGPGDLYCEPDYQNEPDDDADAYNDDLTRVSEVWAYLSDHSACIDVAILDLLNGANISHIPWTPIMHELADAVNYVLTQEEQ